MSSLNLNTLADRAFVNVQSEIDAGRIPGAVLGLIDRQGQRSVRCAGMAQLVPVQRALAPDSYFDLASLTKVLFTTPRILHHCEQGKFSLHDPLIKVLPDLQQYNPQSWIREISFAQCLSHQTALPAVEPIYTYGTDTTQLRAFVLQRQWQAGSVVYSDINYMLLGLALERIEGVRIRDMYAGDGFSFSADPSSCAATEYCFWREKMLCGDVHDENCHALEGAGHAGLFGAANSILNHAHGLLDGTACSARTLEAMRHKVSDTRTYGWQYAHTGWSGGSRCSADTIGHTGFTGTGLWIDFDNGLAWTLLSNRIHPTRHCNSRITQLRQAVGESLYS